MSGNILEKIQEISFKQSALGYSRDQVHEFLDEVALEYEKLEKQCGELLQENQEAFLKLETYKNVEESLKETLLLAQKTAQETIRSAQKEADAIQQKAQVEKEALLFSAKETLADTQMEIRKLEVERSQLLLKLRSLLKTSLEQLEAEYPESQPGTPQTTLDDERIIDFSRRDLVIEDLSADDEANSETDAEDFSAK